METPEFRPLAQSASLKCRLWLFLGVCVQPVSATLLAVYRLLGGRLEDVDQCDNVPILPKADVLLPIVDTLLPSALNGIQIRLSNWDATSAVWRTPSR
jgi:hypothetical protein